MLLPSSCALFCSRCAENTALMAATHLSHSSAASSMPGDLSMSCAVVFVISLGIKELFVLVNPSQVRPGQSLEVWVSRYEVMVGIQERHDCFEWSGLVGLDVCRDNARPLSRRSPPINPSPLRSTPKCFSILSIGAFFDPVLDLVATLPISSRGIESRTT